jgi:hypothetical protein
MTPDERKLLDDQIEADMIADLDDPSAWDEPIFVQPSKSPTPPTAKIAKKSGRDK